MMWLGENYHEVGHHAPELSDLLPGMKKYNIGFDSRVGRVTNLIEDWRNERNNHGKFPGRCKVLSYMQGFYCNRGAEALAKPGAKSEDQFMTDLFGWIYKCRAEWQPDLVAPSMKFSRVSNPDRFDEFYNELYNIVTFDDVYALVCKLFDADPESDLEDELEKAKSAAEGEEGETGESEEGEGEYEADGKVEESEDGGKSGGTVKYEDLIGHVHKGESGGAGGEYGVIEYTEDRYYDYKPYRPDEIIVQKARDLPRVDDLFIPCANEHISKGSKLSQKVKRLFQSRTQSLTEHNRKSGRLDKRDLYRIPSGARDVFTRKVDKISTQGTVLYLLVDASGSMSGPRFEAACAASVLMAESMAPLKVPVKISAFTERSRMGESQLEDYIIKDYTEHRTREKMVEDFGKVSTKLHQNADGDSLMLAYRDIMSRPEKRKMIIVLSDGMPCCDRPGDAASHLRDVVEYIGSSCELYGIGIESRSVESFYPECKVLSRVSELEPTLLSVIKRKFI